MTQKNITLEHGSGGALSRELVEELIFPALQNSLYTDLTDATGLPALHSDFPGNLLMTTDTYTVNPPFFPGGDIGSLAVYGTCNDLAVSGGRPLYLSMGLVLEEGFPLEDLSRALQSMSAALTETGTHVVTGDTKVVPQGKGGGIYINTCGIGETAVSSPLGINMIMPGDKVIVSGPLGSHGAAVLAARENLPGNELLQSDAASLYPLCEKLYSCGKRLKFIRDATRGGAAAVLNEITEGRNFGILAEEDRFPVLDKVRSFTQILGLNPLEIANEGVLVAVIDGNSADEALGILRNTDLGCSAAIVGEITEEYSGKVVLKTAIGGKKILGFPRGLLLPRIC